MIARGHEREKDEYMAHRRFLGQWHFCMTPSIVDECHVLSKLIKCMSPTVKHTRNCGLLVVMIGQHVFINDDTYTILVGDAGNGRGCKEVRRLGHMWNAVLSTLFYSE